MKWADSNGDGYTHLLIGSFLKHDEDGYSANVHIVRLWRYPELIDLTSVMDKVKSLYRGSAIYAIEFHVTELCSGETKCLGCLPRPLL